MNIEIRGRNVPLTDELKAHADQRLHLALSRFSNRIRSVKVVFEDVNGPKGGPDKKCLVTVKLDGGDELRVEDGNGDLRFIIDSVADRVGRLVAREIERQREAHSSKAARFNGKR
ncbi:MAG: HPF/RaiA family ribosome-associated protein [Myxococcaceae bacterium]|nr:HPF/RaiA family ribosome-associated protein [Myxococcaceae bacterium]